MDKILQLLGIAKRASKIAFGIDMVCEKLRKGEVKLIFVASDASISTIDTIEKKAFYYNVKICKSYTTDELSHSIGLNNIKVIGILDEGLSKGMDSLFVK